MSRMNALRGRGKEMAEREGDWRKRPDITWSMKTAPTRHSALIVIGAEAVAGRARNGAILIQLITIKLTVIIVRVSGAGVIRKECKPRLMRVPQSP